jgi:hypothetical protein
MLQFKLADIFLSLTYKYFETKYYNRNDAYIVITITEWWPEILVWNLRLSKKKFSMKSTISSLNWISEQT